MSLVKTKKIQIGDSATATNNFFLQQPTVADGTMRLGSGSSEYIRFNSTSPYLEVWNGSAWEEISGGGGDFLPLTGGTLTGPLNITGGHVNFDTAGWNFQFERDASSRVALEFINGSSVTEWTITHESAGGLVLNRGSGSGNFRVSNSSGYVDIGPQNTSWMHLNTDLPSFYMNKGLRAAGDIGVYNVNTYLSSNDLYLDGEIYHYGDTNTYMQFHAADQWRVVTGGAERIEANNTDGVLMATAKVTGTLIVPVK